MKKHLIAPSVLAADFGNLQRDLEMINRFFIILGQKLARIRTMDIRTRIIAIRNWFWMRSHCRLIAAISRSSASCSRVTWRRAISLFQTTWVIWNTACRLPMPVSTGLQLRHCLESSPDHFRNLWSLAQSDFCLHSLEKLRGQTPIRKLRGQTPISCTFALVRMYN